MHRNYTTVNIPNKKFFYRDSIITASLFSLNQNAENKYLICMIPLQDTGTR